MFDIGWSEMAIIAVVTLVVLGPKELPHALKTISHWMRAARKLGSEFQSGVNEIVREAELDDAKRELQKLSTHSISDKIEKAIDPSGELKKAINAPVEETKAVISSSNDAPAVPTIASVADLPPFPGPSQPAPAAAVPGSEMTQANADAVPADLTKSDKSVSA
jgi:sec-independent protein translocase protein TatB